MNMSCSTNVSKSCLIKTHNPVHVFFLTRVRLCQGPEVDLLTTMPPFTFQFTLLQSYKALLVKLSPRGYLEEPGVMVHQAKSKIWTGVRPKRFMIGVDPKGAFIRIKDALLRAQHEGRMRAKEKIRKALPPELMQKVAPPREFGDMFGKNGVMRVRRIWMWK